MKCFLFGKIGPKSTALCTLTIFLQHKADDFAAKANFRGIEFCHFSGLALQALRVAIPTFFVALVAGTDTVTEALNAIPEVVTRGLQIAGIEMDEH